MSRAHTGPMTDESRAHVLSLVKRMLNVLKGEQKTDICNAALHLGVTMAVMGGATQDMVEAVIKELCEKLNAERSH